MIEESDGHGLRLTSFDGSERKIAAERLTLSENPSLLDNAGTVLVSVKRADTAAIADLIAQHAPIDAVVISLQNGVSSAGAAPAIAGPARAGLVACNVVSRGEGRFHRATSGDIVLEQTRPAPQMCFRCRA